MAPAIAILGFGIQNQAFGAGCSLLVGQQVASVFLPGNSTAQLRLPIPNDPALRGVEITAQAAVIDTPRSPIGSVTVTAALRITIGD